MAGWQPKCAAQHPKHVNSIFILASFLAWIGGLPPMTLIGVTGIGDLGAKGTMSSLTLSSSTCSPSCALFSPSQSDLGSWFAPSPTVAPPYRSTIVPASGFLLVLSGRGSLARRSLSTTDHTALHVGILVFTTLGSWVEDLFVFL